MTFEISPNAVNTWVRDNDDTLDLSPETCANSIYMDSNNTLENVFEERATTIVTTGQSLIKQEEQLADLERMLASNVVTMNYNNALLKLNLEMDEVK